MDTKIDTPSVMKSTVTLSVHTTLYSSKNPPSFVDSPIFPLLLLLCNFATLTKSRNKYNRGKFFT